MSIPFNENEFAPNLAEGYDDNYVAAMAELQENFISTGGDASWRKQKLYHIVDKNEGKTILFNDNRVQEDLNNYAHEWLLILKARQFGVSTKYLIENFDQVLWNPNTWCAIIAHDQRTLETLFSKIRFAWDRMDPSIKEKLPQPRSESKYELYWPELNSRIYVALKCLGGTNQIVHFSEDARIPDSRYAETLETVPKTGRVVRESTPTEINTRFHRDYIDGKKQKNGFVSKFYPWWWGDDYKLPVRTVKESNLSAPEQALIENYDLTFEQIEWRRWKWQNLEQTDGSNLFPREYPEDDITCFLSSGDAAFDQDYLQWYHGWLQNNAKAKAYVKGYIGEAKNGRSVFREGEKGPLKIHEPPRSGIEYCAGVDVSMGYESSDWQTIQIVRRDNDYQCAEYRIKTDISLFSKDVEMLCKFYNEAYVNPERNSMGEVVIRHLLLNYENSNIYAEDDPIKVRKSRITKYGYWSGIRYKQALVALIQAYLNDDQGFIFSIELIEEMMAYQKHNLRTMSHGTRDVGFSGKKHDDLIIGFGLALEHNRVLPPFHRPKTDYISIYHAIAKARRKNQGQKQPKNAMCY